MNQSFGAYQLGEPLGTLPFGELVAAAHPARSESLALLLLDARLSGDHRFRGLVRLEMARVGGLRQPGIARMVEISEHSGALAVVYERPAAGVSLATRLADGPALGLDNTHRLIRRLAEALDAAHGRRIVHGLLGPASFLIGSDGAATLVGAGLLAAVEEAGLRDFILERAESASIAPEQAGGKLTVASADGYALAVLARQALGAGSGQAAATLDRQSSPVPAQRFPSCVAFATALAEASAAAGPGAATGSGAPAGPGAPDLPSTAALAASPDAASTPPPPPPTISPPPSEAAPPPAYAAPPPAYAAPPPAYAAPPPAYAVQPAPAPSAPADLIPAEPPAAQLAPPPAAPPSPPAPAEPLPWDVPQAAAAPPAYGQPPAHTLPPTSEQLPSSARLPSWLRDSLDPPNARSQRGPVNPQTTPPLTQPSQLAPAAPHPTSHTQHALWRSTQSQPPTVTRSRPTPAMLTFQKTQARTDLGTTLVLTVTERVAFLDRLVDQYAPDGKIGRAPLGVVVAVALAALLLLLRQPAAAAILGVLVLGLYIMPGVLGKIVAADQPPPEAVHVSGTVSVRKRTVGTHWDVFEMDIEDGVPLTLPASGYRWLASLGRPITAERPTMDGSEQVTVAHELSDVTVTYFVPGRALLDVRDASGTVIYRHPDYAGEPGDRVSLDAPSAGTEPASGRGATAFARPHATPTWKPTAYGHQIMLRMPPVLGTELQAAFKSAAVTAGLLDGIPLLILIGSAMFGDFGFFALILAGIIFVMIGAGQTTRAITLYKAREAESIVLVEARMNLRHVERTGSKGSKSQHFFLRLDDGADLKIQKDLFERLARLGRPLDMGERPGIWERMMQSEETVHAYEVQGSRVTYEPSSELLLEVMDAGGNTLYRDSAITPRSLADVPPKQP